MDSVDLPSPEALASELISVGSNCSAADELLDPVSRHFATNRDWDGLDEFMSEVARCSLTEVHLAATKEPDYNVFRSEISEMIALALRSAASNPAIIAFAMSYYYDGSDDGRFGFYLCDKGPDDVADWMAFFVESLNGPLVHPYFEYWSTLSRSDPPASYVGFAFTTNRMMAMIGRVWEQEGNRRIPFAFDETEGFFPILL